MRQLKICLGDPRSLQLIYQLDTINSDKSRQEQVKKLSFFLSLKLAQYTPLNTPPSTIQAIVVKADTFHTERRKIKREGMEIQ
jgi:hypothetical protein